MSTSPGNVLTLPHAAEAELALLGSVLLDNQAMPWLKGRLQAEDFYAEPTRTVFGAMLELHAEGVAIDVTTLLSRVGQNRSIQVLGGSHFLLGLTDRVPSAANYRHYARIILEKSDLRRAIERLVHATDRAHSGNVEDIGSFLDDIVRDVEGVRERSSARLADHLDELAPTRASAYGLEELASDEQCELLDLSTLPPWPSLRAPDHGHGLGRWLGQRLGGVRPGEVVMIGATTRPDGVPTVVFVRDDQRALFALVEDAPGARSELTLVDGEATAPAFHEVDGELWLSWVSHPAGTIDRVLQARPLFAADPATAAVTLADLGSGDALPRNLALTALAEAHAVRFDGGELTATPPLAYSESLSQVLQACSTPTCGQGCAEAEPCTEHRRTASGLAVQSSADAVRTWHLECEWQHDLTWETGSFFDLLCLCDRCRCDAVSANVVEAPCALVASQLVPSSQSTEALVREELWRLPLDLERSQLEGAAALVSADRLWLLVEDRARGGAQLLSFSAAAP